MCEGMRDRGDGRGWRRGRERERKKRYLNDIEKTERGREKRNREVQRFLDLVISNCTFLKTHLAVMYMQIFIIIRLLTLTLWVTRVTSS